MVTRWWKNTAKSVLLAGSVGLAGCSTFIAEQIVEAPNKGAEVALENNRPLKELGVDEEFRVTVGPPTASLSCWIMEPKGEKQFCKGTILMLHGIYASRGELLDLGRKLTDAGYRAVLVDLRGHGASTGDYVTYGVRESHDLSQVLDELETRGLAKGAVGVYGVSYGAATAIELAGLDSRVKGVVAVASFASLREEVPSYAVSVVPILASLVSEDDYQQAVRKAGEIGGFNPDEASPLKAIGRTRAPVLLVHGDADRVVPLTQARELHAAALDHSKLMVMSGLGHNGVEADLGGEVARETIGWFDRWLGHERADGQ